MKNMRRSLLIIALLVAALVITNVVLAHANLVRAEPPPNSVLDTAPAEIRMWFSEPLEHQFSKINLRDKDGNILNTPVTIIDPSDSTQMYMIPGTLPNGLYTVVWRSLSAADGHPSLGSYPLVIGDASLLQGTTNQVADIIRPDSSMGRIEFHESTPTAPQNPYGQNKLEIEQMLAELARRHQVHSLADILA